MATSKASANKTKKSSGSSRDSSKFKKIVNSSKKTVVKSDIKKQDVTQMKEEMDFVENKMEIGDKAKKIRLHKTTVIIAIIIILLGLGLYFGRGMLVAAVVNGQPITRYQFASEAEKASGRQVMTSIIRNTLVEQEAKKKNIVISEKDIDKQVKTIEGNLSKQGQKLDQMLELQGMTMDDLRKIVKLDLTVTKLLGDDIKVTDKDVAKYMEDNKDILPKDKSEDEIKKQVKEQLEKQQLPEKAQAWFAEIEKKANIVKFVNY